MNPQTLLQTVSTKRQTQTDLENQLRFSNATLECLNCEIGSLTEKSEENIRQINEFIEHNRTLEERLCSIETELNKAVSSCSAVQLTRDSMTAKLVEAEKNFESLKTQNEALTEQFTARLVKQYEDLNLLSRPG